VALLYPVLSGRHYWQYHRQFAPGALVKLVKPKATVEQLRHIDFLQQAQTPVFRIALEFFELLLIDNGRS